MRLRSNDFTIVASCSLLVLTAFAINASAAKESEAVQPDAAPRWEHLALTHGTSVNDSELAKKINSLGDEGWELVDVTTKVGRGTTSGTMFFFKRPK